MRIRRMLSLLLTVFLLLSNFPFVAAASGERCLSLEAVGDQEGEMIPGETVTVTVKIGADNPGFCVGTFYFEASENLTCVSATCLSEECRFIEAQSGEYEGCVGIPYLEAENFSDTETDFCTITFRADAVGDYQIKIHSYDLRGLGGSGVLQAITADDVPAVTGYIKMPPKPVVTTEHLPDGMEGVPYSFALEADVAYDITYHLIDGELPDGLTLSEEGLIAGTAGEVGTFSLTVSALRYGLSESEPKTLTLTIVERPEMIRLKSSDGLSLDEGVLRGLCEKTSVEVFLDLFDNDALRVFDGDGNEIMDPYTYVGTGFELQLMHEGQVIDRLTVLLLGDTDGDGEIGSRDYQLIRAHYLGNHRLDGIYFQAGLVSGDEEIGSRDYQQVRAHYLGNYNIYGKVS